MLVSSRQYPFSNPGSEVGREGHTNADAGAVAYNGIEPISEEASNTKKQGPERCEERGEVGLAHPPRSGKHY